ncbi:MAG TPA: hydroxysqualene dehydroxylase HpnE [Thiobacillaceae bacterium]|nr:hydroxysqualene dehydroxylase HpnE [Thiobacillaceae bacterium]
MTAFPRSPQVAVIGGGWAGCTAALTLAEAGVAVTLYEAGHLLGGRARTIELAGRTLDNGQHILLGAYRETLRLIQHLQPADVNESLWRLPLTLRQPPDFSLACPPLPAPLHLLAGLFGAAGLSLREKLAAVRWAHAMTSTRAPEKEAASAHLSVAALTRDQPERVNRLLWHPLCVSALNTPPEAASARVFRNVLQTAFGANRTDSDMLLPRRDLSALLPVPAAGRVRELGGEVRSACRVTTIEPAAGGVMLVTRDGMRAHSHAIIAVAPQHLAALVSPTTELRPLAAQMAGYRYEPIATAYVQYDPHFRLPEPMYALAGGPTQFVFDRGQSHGQAGLMAFVASTATGLSSNWMDDAEAQLQRIADPGPASWRRGIVEKQATYACVPDLPRPPVGTGHPRIFLAGDYTEGPYPATLESATQSGLQSARTLLQSL